jgi:hypothetical protein
LSAQARETLIRVIKERKKYISYGTIDGRASEKNEEDREETTSVGLVEAT